MIYNRACVTSCIQMERLWLHTNAVRVISTTNMLLDTTYPLKFL